MGVNSPDLVVLGHVAGAHALRGEVRVRYLGDGPENLLVVREVWLADGAHDRSPVRYEVRCAGTGRAGEVRLSLSGVGDREAASALRGLLVQAEAAALLPLEEGEFYWHQLVGCRVVARDGSEIGVVREIWETGAHDLAVVEAPDGARYLLSTARALMPEVDVEARRIVVELLPGMLEPLPQTGRSGRPPKDRREA